MGLGTAAPERRAGAALGIGLAALSALALCAASFLGPGEDAAARVPADAALRLTAASKPPADTPSFSAQVAPILFRHCAACHRPDGVAPFSVLSYEEARRMAPHIAKAAAERRMPPWLPAPGRGDFDGERRLTEAEIRTLAAWAEAGAPEGDPGVAPAPPARAAGWYLGEPDLVVELPRPYRVPAGDHDLFRNFVIPLPFDDTRWVTAVELRVDGSRVVHHINLMVDPTHLSRRLEARDPEPGYDAHDSHGTATMPPGFFLGWTPGRIPARYRDGLAWPLDGLNDLVLQFHLRPGDRPTTVSAQVGLHFTDSPPAHVPTGIKLTSETIDIPAGASDHLVTDTYELPVDVEVLGIYPHAHYLAREFQVLASVPGEGRPRWLVHIPRWDFDWQDAYAYREAVALPAGTTLTMRILYDNSAGNPVNPHRPPRRVTHGPLSTDEMGDVYLNALTRTEADRRLLERDQSVKRVRDRLAGLDHRLSLEPRSVAVLTELGDLHIALRAFDRAARYFDRAVEVRPDDPDAHLGLGIALQGAGEPGKAVPHFTRAIELRPDDAAAHYALAKALVHLGRNEEAMARYRRVVELEPAHAEAHHDLAAILLDAGWIQAGLDHAARAVEAYVAAGDREAAADLAAQILAVADEVGDAELVQDIRRLLDNVRSQR